MSHNIHLRCPQLHKGPLGLGVSKSATFANRQDRWTDSGCQVMSCANWQSYQNHHLKDQDHEKWKVNDWYVWGPGKTWDAILLKASKHYKSTIVGLAMFWMFSHNTEPLEQTNIVWFGNLFHSHHKMLHCNLKGSNFHTDTKYLETCKQ